METAEPVPMSGVRLAFALVGLMLLTAAATVVLLAERDGASVVYEGF